MASLFISYSRKDIESARKLTEAFKGQGLDFWIDWEGIPPTVNWWKEIEKGIEEADIFLFLLSPNSVKSQVCRQEVDHAVKNGKRLIPAVVSDIKAEEVPTELGSLNWIYVRNDDELDPGLQKLITAIQTDYAWVQAHRQLQVKALEWERNRRENGFLLHGEELQEAEIQLATNSSKEPYPTDLQREYVLKSRQVTDKQRRILTSATITGLILVAILAVYGFVQAGNALNAQATAEANLSIAQTAQIDAQNKEAARATQQALAEERARIARAGELATLSQTVRDSQLDLASLLSLESYYSWDFLRSRAVLANNLITNPHLHQFLPKYSSWVSSIAFNPIGNELASSGCIKQINLDCVENAIVIWQLENGELKAANSISTSKANSLAYNFDGSMLASGWCIETEEFECLHSKIILWDTGIYQPVGSLLQGVPNNIQSLVFSPDGNFLAVAGCTDTSLSNCSNSEIQVWDLHTRSQLGEPVPTDTGIVNISFSPNGQILASSGWDGVITLWKFKNGQITESIPTLNSSLEAFPAITFSPDGKTILSGGTDDILRLWDVETGQLLHEFTGHTDDIYTVAFSPDGTLFASGGLDNTVRVWNKNYNVLTHTFRGHSTDIIDVKFSPDGNFLASTSQDGQMLLWDVEDDLPLGEPGPIAGFGLLNTSFRADGDIVTVDLVNGELIVRSANRTVPIGKPIATPEDFASHLALSPDYKTIALGGQGLISLTDLSSGQSILDKPITGQEEHVTALAFSPDGITLASGGCYNRREDGVCPSGIIYLWNARSGAQIRDPIIGHESWVNALAFSPDGKLLASGSTDDTILLWNISDRELIGIPFVGHTNKVTSLSFSPDGKMLASAAENGEIFLWDVQTHQIIVMLNENGSYFASIHNITFSPDGTHLISSDHDGNSMIWEVSPDQWSQATCQRVGRNFTRAEWAYYFPTETYRKTCEQWPLEPEPTP